MGLHIFRTARPIENPLSLYGRCVQSFQVGRLAGELQLQAIGEERDTIEDVLEPYLIQQGFLQRTPRGRVATLLTYRHFGLAAPDSSNPVRDLWDSGAS